MKLVKLTMTEHTYDVVDNDSTQFYRTYQAFCMAPMFVMLMLPTCLEIISCFG